MDDLKTFIFTWYNIFIWAHICIYERFTGQEVSCPDCWKCTTMRWLLFAVYGGALILVGYWILR